MSIPKIIHYCWFGRGEMPEEYKRYIESWRKFCPDYEIKEWNEDTFDVNCNEYVKRAYEARRFAFVSDYARICALYNEGGIYMDTDVEVLKNLDDFLHHNAFSGFENNNYISTGFMASEKGGEWVENILHLYDGLTFVKSDGSFDLTTNVARITGMTVEKYGLDPHSSYQELGVVTVYPHDYFSPKDWNTGNIVLTENSRTIHHFAGSWHTDEEKKSIEKNRLLREKYVKKYGEEKTEKIFERREKVRRYINYLCHPTKAFKKIAEKLRGKGENK